MQTFVVLYWFLMTYPVYQSYSNNLDDDGQRTMATTNDQMWQRHIVATAADRTHWMYFTASTMIFYEALVINVIWNEKQQRTAS